jgi:FkbM family methyltransferase
MAYESDLIYDVGMNFGEDTSFYLAKGFRVVAIEASPTLCADGREKFGDAISSGQLVIVHAAVAETDGPIPLYLNALTAWNTIRPGWSDRNSKLGSPTATVVSVPGVRFNSLIEQYGVPYYLKIDIEGADMLCAESLTVPDVPRYLSIESDKLDWSALLHEFDVLRDRGYRRFKVVGQHRVPKQVPPIPAREGEYAPRSFTLNCSGLFGEEAPGTWMSASDAIELYRRIFRRYRLRGDTGLLSQGPFGKHLMKVVKSPGWYDTHASL